MKRLIRSISGLLTAREEKIAIAESVTGGDILCSLSEGKNALRFFEGGIVAYTMEQKVRHLGVDKEEATECNSVSAGIARQMAKGVSGLFGTHWGVGITGYASPVPERNIFQLFAWMAFCYKQNIVLAEQIKAPGLAPPEARQFYKEKLLDIFEKILLSPEMNNT